MDPRLIHMIHQNRHSTHSPLQIFIPDSAFCRLLSTSSSPLHMQPTSPAWRPSAQSIRAAVAGRLLCFGYEPLSTSCRGFFLAGVSFAGPLTDISHLSHLSVTSQGSWCPCCQQMPLCCSLPMYNKYAGYSPSGANLSCAHSLLAVRLLGFPSPRRKAELKPLCSPTAYTPCCHLVVNAARYSIEDLRKATSKAQTPPKLCESN